MINNLLEGLATSRAKGDKLTVFLNPDSHPSLKFPSEQVIDIEWNSVPFGRTSNRFVRETKMLNTLAAEIEVVLLPNYFTPPSLSACGRVTVIHDLQDRHLPANFARRKRLWLRASISFTARHANAIVAISNFVRSDIIEHLGTQYEDKVFVIPNPVSWSRFDFAQEFDLEPLLGRPTETRILSVASHYPHKNLETLLHAFRIVSMERPASKLILVGQLSRDLRSPQKGFDVVSTIDRLHLSRRVEVTGHISDAELGRQYRSASLVVIPSLFEGFGMPAVEALGLGVPVLATRCGALKEVTFGEAQYIDNPLNAAEMAERIIGMIDDPASFKPTRDLSERLRRTYDPVTIGEKYLWLMRQVAAK